VNSNRITKKRRQIALPSLFICSAQSLAVTAAVMPPPAAAPRDFAGCLSGRPPDVYQVMPAKAGAGCEQPMFLSLAVKRSISPARISKDREKIRKMIREYSRRVHRFSCDRR